MGETVEVSFSETHGYVALHPKLPWPLTALSLALLRQRVEAVLPNARLTLDRKARQERDQRRKGGHGGPSQLQR